MNSVVPLLAAAVMLPLAGLPAAPAPTAAGSPLLAPRFAPRDPGGKVEEVQFSTEDKLKLTATYFAPRKKGRAHAVLLVHDAGGDRRQLEELGTALQRVGFAALAVDLRAHGASVTRDSDWSKLDEASQARTWVLTQRDLASAASFLRSREDVHASSLTLVGYRSGSGTALRYASSDLNVRAVVLLDPIQDELGFNLVKDLQALEALQTLVVAPKDARSNAERLAKAGHTAAGSGPDWIHTLILKSESTAMLEDKRLGREVSDWLRNLLLPSKG
jgi:dienelactone hydrolase